MPTFTAWAAGGLYSTPLAASSSLPPSAGAAAGLTAAFTTYLASAALSQARFSATPLGRTFFRDEFQQGRTCTTLGDVCRDHHGGTYYWDAAATQRIYGINEPNRAWAVADADARSPRRAAIEEMGYEASAFGLLAYLEAATDAYMPLLFDGAYNCTLEGRAGGAAVFVDADGAVDVDCLSSLPIYLSKGSSCPPGAVEVGGKCPFGFNG